MAEVSRFPHVPGHGPITAKLIEKMQYGKPGDRLTDEELQKLVGISCATRGKGYTNLCSAIRYLERTRGVVWRREKGAGCISCLNAEGRVAVADSSRRHVARVSKRAVRVLGTVNAAELSEGERSRVLALGAQFGTLVMFSSSDAQKKLSARNISSAPDMAKLLEWFPRT